MSSFKRVTTKQLGELLIERKVIAPEHLQKALDFQKVNGGLIGEILVQLGFAKEEDIAQVLTAQYGFPYLPLANYDIDADTVKVVPEHVARQYCLIPIDKIGNNLTVAMCNPLNTQAIEDVEMVSKCVVQAFVSTTTDIRRAIERCYVKKSSA
jgi:type IV pilus assembly protein PilB